MIGPASGYLRGMDRRSFDLSSGVTAPAEARRLCADACADWSLDPVIHDCSLMVSELVTNAVVHGGGSIALELQHHDGCLRVSVIDAAPLGTGTFRPTGRPAGRSAGDEEESGRGLAIVAALAARWGSQPGSDRTRVWFELGL